MSETRQRQRRVTIRLDEPEWNRLSDDAEQSGLTLAGQFRMTYYKTPPPRQSHRPVVDREILAATLAAVGAIGNNINQLTKLSHFGSWPETARLQEACDDIRWMRQQLMQALGVSPDPPKIEDFKP